MKFMKNEEAFTGLEAAIVLIAFVVVAAVFSYVMLGAGFFTTQKSQEVVHTGVAQASSSIELIGNVYGTAGTAGAAELVNVKFTLGSTAGGTGVDAEKILITYRDNATSEVIAQNADVEVGPVSAGHWWISKKQNADSDNIIEPGEQFTFEVGIPVSTAEAVVNNGFTIEVKPSEGAVLPIFRSVPAYIDVNNILY